MKFYRLLSIIVVLALLAGAADKMEVAEQLQPVRRLSQPR